MVYDARLSLLAAILSEYEGIIPLMYYEYCLKELQVLRAAITSLEGGNEPDMAAVEYAMRHFLDYCSD